MTTNTHFGLIIKQLIKANKTTITETALKMGYTRQGLTDVLEKEDVNTAVLKKVCEVFNIEMAYFMSGNSSSINQIGNSNNSQDGKNHYTSTVGENSSNVLQKEIEGLKREINSYKDQIKLQRELIDVLKSK